MSEIEGIGVFSVEFIPVGTVVWQLDERFYAAVSKEELPKLPPIMREHFARYGWPHMTRPGLILCDIDNGRFMNHSDTPNTDFTHPVLAYATQDIPPGDEITCDYSQFDPDFTGFDLKP